MAGGALEQAALLGLGMFAIQASIGAVNDVVDAPVDALVKPFKPIPSGAISRLAAAAVGTAAGLGGIVLSLLAGGPVVAGLGLAVLAAGLAYDFVLKPTPYAGLCYAVAFMAVPVYGWWGVAGGLPPRSELLLPIAALAGPTLQLANGLVDLEADSLTGVRGPAVRLGRGATLVALGLLQAVIHGIAWLSMVADGSRPDTALSFVAVGSLVAAAGWWWSGSLDLERREWGWRAQASSIVLVGIGWLAAAI
ncbi:MAG: UbiA family prenyltransferase [Chloroflexota bacterium]|nr:UbiA family prenyltransferase [Chloroflexota bacterium]